MARHVIGDAQWEAALIIGDLVIVQLFRIVVVIVVAVVVPIVTVAMAMSDEVHEMPVLTEMLRLERREVQMEKISRLGEHENTVGVGGIFE